MLGLAPELLEVLRLLLLQFLFSLLLAFLALRKAAALPGARGLSAALGGLAASEEDLEFGFGQLNEVLPLILGGVVMFLSTSSCVARLRKHDLGGPAH